MLREREREMVLVAGVCHGGAWMLQFFWIGEIEERWRCLGQDHIEREREREILVRGYWLYCLRDLDNQQRILVIGSITLLRPSFWHN